MTTIPQTLALFALGVVMASCSGPRARDFADKGPPLNPKAYFSGHLQSSGMVIGRTGKVHDQFTTRMHGVPSKNGLLLIQDFTFASGRKQHRVWDIDVLDAHHFEGQANDSVGLATGEAWGNAFEWNYTLAVPVKGRPVNVTFHQIMQLQPDGVLLNRVQYRKFGVKLGSVSESFRKVP